jgi:hypothetical protein
MSHASVYERVTEEIVRELEQGVAPWVKPWGGGGSAGIPYNATSHRRYSGVNVLLLWGAGLCKGYRSNVWFTFKQARGLDGHVKKGEHGCHVVYASTFSRRERDTDTGEDVVRSRPCVSQRFGGRVVVSDTADLWYDRKWGITVEQQAVQSSSDVNLDRVLTHRDTLHRCFSTTLARTNQDANTLSRDGDLHIIGADEHPL